MFSFSVRGSAAGLAVLALVVASTAGWSAETITLKNGMILQGSPGRIASIGGDPLTAISGGGAVPSKQILVIDDYLRRTFCSTLQVAGASATPALPIEKFVIPQRVNQSGKGVVSVGPILRITPFDEHGRRIFSMNTSDGPVHVVQGITEIAPTYTKVEALKGNNAYVWSMSIATSSIPRDTLSKILHNYIDPKKSDDRVRIVRLYLQSERIQDARAELDSVIEDFSGLEALAGVSKTLTQMSAQRLIREVELRRDAGQPLLAIAMLEKFPSEGVAGETLLKVRDLLAGFQSQAKQGHELLASIDRQLALVKDEKLREDLAAIVDEIKTEMNIHTLDRLADYARLSTDPALTPENKLSLAISGWLLGTGSGIDNLVISRSLVEVRSLVREYLASTRQPERDAVLAQMESLEGATPAYIAMLIAHMRPPLEPAPETIKPGDPADVEAAFGPKPAASDALPLEPENDGDCGQAKPKKGDKPPGLSLLDVLPGGKSAAAPPAEKPTDADDSAKADEPAAITSDMKIAGATATPGLFEMTVAGLSEDPQIKYWVQLPPEYSPYRRYPCIVTLNGGGTTPLEQIDWWAGAYKAEANMRFGQAARHGYIVIAPQWMREHQRQYEYTAREHAAVLYPLRDACKRFAIDTDRVFLSGHSLGGDAAWDIGLAHPDLWAGVLPIVATAAKYVTRYWENAKYVPMYFVCGEKDGNKLAQNSIDWDRYLTRIGFDTMIVQYQGRGHEHFHDEIQTIFDWMNLHKRNFFPADFSVTSMRPWDSFFWWLEISALPDTVTVLPAEWPKSIRSASTEGKILKNNSVLTRGVADRVTVWFAPEMVDFSAKVSAMINGRQVHGIAPSAAVLLEDVRTRGDRQHPFWAKAQWP
ncbi:MAG: peptidase [Pirellulaceae bacterium]